VHPKAEPLPALAQRLLVLSTALAADKHARVEGAVSQMARVAGKLHDAADEGDAARTQAALTQLDGLLELIAAQYPAGALDGAGGAATAAAHDPTMPMHDHSALSSMPGHDHRTRPLAAVDAPPEATIVVTASEFAFEPSTIELRAGVPTRIELDNRGALVEHSLLVHAPSGGDWIHLHAAPKGTDAGTYRIDTPGSYEVLCTIPGHTESGMVGKLVVAAR
jgi:plastocyanin